jgi:acyl-CoA synthetase (NDP forming)
VSRFPRCATRVVTAASLRWFFKPNGVAVIGASARAFKYWLSDPASLDAQPISGARLCRPIPKQRSWASMRAYASVSELPEPVDLAVLAVPKDAVLSVID